jgi:hypothetical protein
LLEAARDLDRGNNVIEVQDRHGKTWTQRPGLQTSGRRAAFATLLLGGGRASATGAMLWRNIDLANGRFEVGRDKTDAGMREVDMLPLLREILTEHKAASSKTGPDDPVFLTSTGTARSRHNLRQDVVEPVVNRANRLVEERALQPPPIGITPHKLRHTFASILVAIGKAPTYVMQQLGHTDPTFTLRVYSHMMRRSGEEREVLKALVFIGAALPAHTDIARLDPARLLARRVIEVRLNRRRRAAESLGDLPDRKALGLAEVLRQRHGATALYHTVIRGRTSSRRHAVEVLRASRCSSEADPDADDCSRGKAIMRRLATARSRRRPIRSHGRRTAGERKQSCDIDPERASRRLQGSENGLGIHPRA